MDEKVMRGASVGSALVLGSALWLCAATAQSQSAPEESGSEPTTGAASAEAPDSDRPWAKGVAAADQARAIELFRAGNALLDETLFKAALDKYREAIALWDHPAIRYNMVVCHINLDQPIAAYESLEAALRWGPDPLEVELYTQALTYKRLLQGQLAQLVVRCDEPGARVTLEGRELIACPGEYHGQFEVGKYQLIAAKPGFLPRTYRLNLAGGEKRQLTVELISAEQAAVSRQRWDPWKPWTVVGAGAALVLVGVPFELRSNANYDTFDRAIAQQCDQDACHEYELPSDARDARDRAILQNRVAIGLFASGALVAATGVTLLLLNRPRTSFRAYPEEDAGAPAVRPWVDGDAAGLVGTLSF